MNSPALLLFTTISTFLFEIEEREKVVKQMWDVYTNSRRIKLPRFWQEAFVAAYEELTSDEPQVREAAYRIAKMSLHTIDVYPSWSAFHGAYFV
uniref:Uncharacterized protein n=1 Tax=Helianthus annuus TaxID=4232 RepID=A0A251SGT8_HELAN